jgi:CRP-like cAMP-binding protein
MTIEAFVKQNLPHCWHEKLALPFDVVQKSFAANHVITDYGHVENKILLLSEGLIQISALKGEEDRILEFVFPDEFFCAYTSFLLQQPSDVQVMTLTKSKVSIVKRDDLVRANEVSLLSNQLSLHIAQQLFLSRARREKDFLTLSAEERYLVLLEKDPEVVKLIPGNKIAKYLGIHAESLSRIKKSIIP